MRVAGEEVEEPAEKGGGRVPAGGEDVEGFVAEFEGVLSRSGEFVEEDEFAAFARGAAFLVGTFSQSCVDKSVDVFVDFFAMLREGSRAEKPAQFSKDHAFIQP